MAHKQIIIYCFHYLYMLTELEGLTIKRKECQFSPASSQTQYKCYGTYYKVCPPEFRTRCADLHKDNSTNFDWSGRPKIFLQRNPHSLRKLTIINITLTPDKDTVDQIYGFVVQLNSFRGTRCIVFTKEDRTNFTRNIDSIKFQIKVYEANTVSVTTLSNMINTTTVLTTIPGYRSQAPSVQDSADWHPTIYYTTNSKEVKGQFAPAPEEYRIRYYFICLYRITDDGTTGTTEVTNSMIEHNPLHQTSDIHFHFKDLEPGRYVIYVQIYDDLWTRNNDQCRCKSTNKCSECNATRTKAFEIFEGENPETTDKPCLSTTKDMSEERTSQIFSPEDKGNGMKTTNTIKDIQKYQTVTKNGSRKEMNRSGFVADVSEGRTSPILSPVNKKNGMKTTDALNDLQQYQSDTNNGSGKELNVSGFGTTYTRSSAVIDSRHDYNGRHDTEIIQYTAPIFSFLAVALISVFLVVKFRMNKRRLSFRSSDYHNEDCKREREIIVVHDSVFKDRSEGLKEYLQQSFNQRIQTLNIESEKFFEQPDRFMPTGIYAFALSPWALEYFDLQKLSNKKIALIFYEDTNYDQPFSGPESFSVFWLNRDLELMKEFFREKTEQLIEPLGHRKLDVIGQMNGESISTREMKRLDSGFHERYSGNEETFLHSDEHWELRSTAVTLADVQLQTPLMDLIIPESRPFVHSAHAPPPTVHPNNFICPDSLSTYDVDSQALSLAMMKINQKNSFKTEDTNSLGGISC